MTTATSSAQRQVSAHSGPTMQIAMNVQQSHKLAHLAIRADQVVRRGLSRLGRGRLKASVFEAGTKALNHQICGLEKTLQEVLVMFVPSEGELRRRGKVAGGASVGDGATKDAGSASVLLPANVGPVV